ncbi:hypothetical protein [Actinacidiphila glaucinigra]|uniref:hypothetical protein n=1 Tax=Actinacidiphila glaucinigra TaxID=235986 RepID=UPI00366AEAAC
MARRHTDPDADFDATAYVQNLLQPSPDPAPAPCAWTPPEPAPRRTRRPAGRSYGPDSLPGLADYFTRSCPPLSWAGGLEIGNRQALVAVFSELRREVGLSPEDCRALVDLYISRLGEKRPNRPYVWDFKWQRFSLLKALRDTGVTVTDEQYATWQTSEANGTGDAFTASWGHA